MKVCVRENIFRRPRPFLETVEKNAVAILKIETRLQRKQYLEHYHEFRERGKAKIYFRCGQSNHFNSKSETSP